MNDTVEIKGLAELNKRLKQMPEKLEKKYMKQAMRQGVNIFTKEARQNAPVKTGRLKKSIKTVSLRGKKGDVKMGTVAQERYAHLVEYGTAAHKIVAGSRRGTESGKKVLASTKKGIVFGKVISHPGSKQQPFMRPAFDGSWEKALEKFRATLASNLPDLYT